MRKSSPSFCQDTPDKGSRRHWEVIMIVLTDGKDASSAYCLTTALYCPLPGQYLAIARHKTIRREKKNPHSLFYSSPFTKSSETPINTGVPRGEELASPFTTLHHSSPSDCARNWNGSLTCSVGGWNHFFMSHRFHRFTQIFPGEGWVKSGEEASALFTPSKQLIHNNLRHFGEGWRVFLKLADYRYKLQRNLCKSVKSV